MSWSRAEPRSLEVAARTMYAQGRTCKQVLEAIYGADLPREAYVAFRHFAHDDEGIAVDWKFHPWELMIEPGKGLRAPLLINQIQADEDALAFELAPNVLLLGRLHYASESVRLGGSLFGYDLDELRAGRQTIVGMLQVPWVKREHRFSVFGPSLAEVLNETISMYLRVAEHRERTDPHEDADPVRRHKALLEAYLRDVAE